MMGVLVLLLGLPGAVCVGCLLLLEVRRLDDEAAKLDRRIEQQRRIREDITRSTMADWEADGEA